MYAVAKGRLVEVEGTVVDRGLPRSARDALVYEWVRFEGKSQEWVAAEMGISQGTVSRILQRIERRSAHTPDGQNGRLDPQERVRVQRWLTYERNERLLASCLRIAHDVEGFVDVSRSTVQRNGLASVEQEIRTVHATLDRSGTAARFLRLAFRINMEQLKLAEVEPLEALPPLSAEELAELDSDDEPGDEEAGDEEPGSEAAGGGESLASSASTAGQASRGTESPVECAVKLAELEVEPEDEDGCSEADAEQVAAAPCAGATADQGCPAAADCEPIDEADGGYAHRAHKRIPGLRGASAEGTWSCDDSGRVEKKFADERMGASG